jgi:PAS domain S-box-containing protein
MSLLQEKHSSTYSIFEDVLNWFSSTVYFNEDSLVIKLRKYQITSFFVFFISSFFNFLGGLNYSYTITAISCIGLIFVRYLIDMGKVKTAYFFMLILVNVSMFFLTYVEGLRSGIFLFFFTVVISYTFLSSAHIKNSVLIKYIVCGGTFLAAVLLSPEQSNLQKLTNIGYYFNFIINVLFSFLIVIWMTYSLFKENNRKQKVLEDKEIFLNTIFNSSLHADIIVSMQSGCIEDYNTCASSIFLIGKDATMSGMPACNLFREVMEDADDKLYKDMCDRDYWQGELTCIKADGSEFPGSVSIVSFVYNGKKFKKITVVDITEKKQLMDELRNAKKVAEESSNVKTQFLSNMSHELRTPLNGIIGAANLLIQDEFLPHQKEGLNILRFSSEHMLSLVNEVLDLSKLDAKKMNLEKISVDIAGLIKTITAPFINQYSDKGLQLTINVDTNLKRQVLADPTRLNQILTNLLSNALKFTESGTVAVEVKGIAIKSNENTIEFSVTDTGIGISAEKVKSIFESFTQADAKTTRKYGGTGLGLAISQKLVALMGGQLKVESKYRKGSKFFFELTFPVNQGKEKVYVDKSDTAILGSLKNLHLLIAEDNPVNMMIACRFLDKWGVKYKKAKNGAEAVTLAIAEGNKFDLLLLDLEMPEMDGFGALNKIREIYPDIPAIAFTAAVFENMRHKLMEQGFTDYIQKPFRPEDLYSKLLNYTELAMKRA